MEREFDTEICVIGAGPGGCAIAKRLAELGYAVTLLEAQAFPRPHVGICLSDETYNLLDFLGVGKEVRNVGFLKRKTTVVRWDTETPYLTPQPGIHVDRGVFDSILLENARKAGVKVRQPERVTGIKKLSKGGWQLHIEGKEKTDKLTTSFLVDAAGKSNIFPSKRTKVGSPLFALHAHWKLEEMPNYDGFIEAGTNAWLWFALTGKNRCLISLFTDPKHFSQSKSKSLEAHYAEMMSQFSLMKYVVLDKRVSEVKGCDASSRYSTDPIGKDYIRVGDANFTVDPIAAQGVHLALAMGVQAAVVVNSILRFPKNTAAALTFFRTRQMERITQFTEKTQQTYRKVAIRSSEIFWHLRAGNESYPVKPDEQPVIQLPEHSQAIQLSAQVQIKLTPVMKTEFIENAPALFHPSLPKPVAFLEGYDLVQLIGHIQPGKTLKNIVTEWSPIVPEELGTKMLQWLWNRKIVEPFIRL